MIKDLSTSSAVMSIHSCFADLETSTLGEATTMGSVVAATLGLEVWLLYSVLEWSILIVIIDLIFSRSNVDLNTLLLLMILEGCSHVEEVNTVN